MSLKFVSSTGYDQQKARFGLDNGLALNRRQAIKTELILAVWYTLSDSE